MKRSLLFLIMLAAALVLVAQPVAPNHVGSPMTLTVTGEGNQTVTLDSQSMNVSSDDQSAEMDNDSEDADSDAPHAFFGVVTDNITLAKAKELNYPQFYGIIITDVVRNSPAQKQGLRRSDVLMQINDDRIKDTQNFSDILAMYKAGDTVKLTYFRDGETKVIDFTLGSRQMTYSFKVTSNSDSENNDEDNTDDNDGEDIEIGTHHLGVGGGGIGWIPLWYTPDLDDVNHIFNEYGFDSLSTDGLFMNGIVGQFGVGKGWFLGGYGVWYSLDRSTNMLVNSTNAIRRLRYSVGYGGVTIDKRFALSKKFVVSAGSMIGWGKSRIEVQQYDGSYNWDNLGSDMTSSTNNYINLHKSYIMIQPKVGMMYRITGWLALRAEVGYLASYSYVNGWASQVVDQDCEVKNSPNTSFNGWTFSVGPWFGF